MCLGFDEQKLSDAIFKHYGPGTIFEAARNQSGSPIKGPWTNHCVKIMVANREAGKKPAGDTGSKDPDGLCKSIAVAALFSGTPNLKDGVEKCVNTCQVIIRPAGCSECYHPDPDLYENTIIRSLIL